MSGFFLYTMDCTVYKTLDIISKKWSLLIILEIIRGNGKVRYSVIKKHLPGITPKILSTRLKELEKDGLLKKETLIDPIKTYYHLTDSAKDLIKIINSVKKWGLKWKYNDKTCNSTLCKNCNRTL